MSESTPWSRGYPVSEAYPPSWHSFQSPAHLRAICALSGVAWEVDSETPLSILEVGCGTGYTGLTLAAGNARCQVMGLDYNPAHIAEARSLAAEAGLGNARFLEIDLAEIDGAELDALPEFDLITVHGVWSWVADGVREGVLRIIKRRLKVGGLVFMGYNALPGAAGSLGLARLVRGSMLAAEGASNGTAAASRQIQRLIAAEPAHLPNSAWRRLVSGEVKGARPGYLLHEFMTEHWRPSFHADVAAAMDSVRCAYVGSATIDENFPQMSLTAAQRELWEEAPDGRSRELIFDLCVARAFRRDVYVRGLRRVPREEAVEGIWLASASRAEGEAVLKSQAGEAKLPRALVDTARGALAKGPQTVAALRALPGCGSATPSELLALLMGSGCALPLWREPGSGPDWPQALAISRRFNAAAARRLAPFGAGPGQLGLCTPALGGALSSTALELAVVQRTLQSADGPAEPAGPIDEEAAGLVRRLVPPGPLPAPEVLAELERMAADMLVQRRPVWRALGIV
jgi:SAM-dependent methyltransferase